MNKIVKFYRNLTLQDILTIPFLLQISLVVGLVGYFSFRNGQLAVNGIASKLRNEVTLNVEQHLQNYLEKPQLIVKLNQKAAKLGQLSWKNLSVIETNFWHQIEIFDSVYAIYFGNEAGKFAYVKRSADGNFIAEPVETPPQRQTYLLDANGRRSRKLEQTTYDPRVRPWYIKTIESDRNNWSEIYTFAGGELGITAAGKLYDSQGAFQGILGVDLILTRIGDFLKTIEIGNNGQVFILERNGCLVATSTAEAPFIFDETKQEERRLPGVESKNPFTQATSKFLIQHFGNLQAIDETTQLDFQFDGDRQLVQILPYRDRLGLDWLIVVVVPEDDFLAEINANVRNTILLCLIALIVAATISIYTSRKIARPITHLSQVSTIITKSARLKNTGTGLYPTIKARNIKELEVLAQSFNEMVTQLKTAFKDLEKTNEELEFRVEQRTAALMAAKEAADAANQAKSQFLAHMSHELRTPLHAILGFTQMSLRDSALKPQQRENLLTVKRSGEHLLALINDVLEMSKIEAGKIIVREQPFDLYLLLENLAKMFELQAQAKNLELVFDLAAGVPQYVRSDPTKLRQVLINLLGNAVKFTQTGSIALRVKLIHFKTASIDAVKRSTAKSNPATTERLFDKSANKIAEDCRVIVGSNKQQLSAIAFEVEDTGCGIPPSELDSVFVPFIQKQQLDDSGGTGLGLAIGQQFVRLLGGEITVTSKVRQGSKFQFQIPITIVECKDLTALSTTRQFETSASNSSEKNSHRDRAFKSVPPAIDITTIAKMPSEWILQLHRAAVEVDADSILQLIEQIPARNRALALGLKNMLKNFEYDEIIELTQVGDRPSNIDSD
ncbi:ATP-binding protein [Myxosarcina sp. GI1]|uniref:ATP-binding protein n=1 Tax=Myxosarcina sp. GI1 TaxID=1541065 RepID=UPI000562345D|nr:ATP-binding protein [Myxosarcina sp. GI1]